MNRCKQARSIVGLKLHVIYANFSCIYNYWSDCSIFDLDTNGTLSWLRDFLDHLFRLYLCLSPFLVRFVAIFSAKRKSATKKLNPPDSSHDVIMKKIDSPDNISLIKKQLEAKTREYDLLKNQILDHERILKVSTKQCSFFILRQESSCSGYQKISTHPLEKLFSFCFLS